MGPGGGWSKRRGLHSWGMNPKACLAYLTRYQEGGGSIFNRIRVIRSSGVISAAEYGSYISGLKAWRWEALCGLLNSFSRLLGGWRVEWEQGRRGGGRLLGSS